MFSHTNKMFSILIIHDSWMADIQKTNVKLHCTINLLTFVEHQNNFEDVYGLLFVIRLEANTLV